jgi:hypothetical protein
VEWEGRRRWRGPCIAGLQADQAVASLFVGGVADGGVALAGIDCDGHALDGLALGIHHPAGDRAQRRQAELQVLLLLGSAQSDFDIRAIAGEGGMKNPVRSIDAW